MNEEKKKLRQEPAFPIPTDMGTETMLNNNLDPGGMSKRFYAACAAMQGITSGIHSDEKMMAILETLRDKEGLTSAEIVAKLAYNYADELLKQEQK